MYKYVGIRTPFIDQTSFKIPSSSNITKRTYTATPPLPSSSPLSHHNGYLLQASLCISRLPINYEESPLHKIWRKFDENWRIKTSNQLILSPSLLSEKIKNINKNEIIEEIQNYNTNDEKNELEELLDDEQKFLSNLKQKPKISKKKKKEIQKSNTSAVEATPSTSSYDTALQNIHRHPSNCIYLIVKYRNVWQFPRINKKFDEPMRDALKRMCYEQLGESYTPYFVGYAPFTYERCKPHAEDALNIKRKIFYYRAHHIPGTPDIQPPPDSCVTEYAWMTREELRRCLPYGKWNAIRFGLYLEE